MPYGKKDPWGRTDFFAYGGWWEDRAAMWNDNNFCMNGLISSDWTPHPGVRALKFVQQSVKVELADDGKSITLLNRYDFTNLADAMTLDWAVSEEGTIVRTGSIKVPSIAPGESARVALPADARVEDPEKETFLNLSFKARDGGNWWERGFELAYTQFKLLSLIHI